MHNESTLIILEENGEILERHLFNSSKQLEVKRLSN